MYLIYNRAIKHNTKLSDVSRFNFYMHLIFSLGCYFLHLQLMAWRGNRIMFTCQTATQNILSLKYYQIFYPNNNKMYQQ